MARPRPAARRGADGTRGTGGGLFRALYRDFPAECATTTGDDDLRVGHRHYTGVAPLWAEVSEHIATAGETGDPDHLARASAVLTGLAVRVRRAMRVLLGAHAC